MPRSRAPKKTAPTPTPEPRRSPVAVALDACRHAAPLLPLYLRNGSVPSYLLLTAFDLALGLMLIVGTTRDRSDPTTVDPRATLLGARATAVVVLAVFLGLVAAFVAIPIAMPAFVFGLATGVDWLELVGRPGFWLPVAAMALAAGLRAQHRFEAVTTPGERGTSPHAAPIVGDLEADRRQSQRAYGAQVTLIATYVALCYALGSVGTVGLTVLPILYSTLLTVYDARPDLARRLLPELWRAPPR